LAARKPVGSKSVRTCKGYRCVLERAFQDGHGFHNSLGIFEEAALGEERQLEDNNAIILLSV